jgi:hypothetical protein
MIIIHEFVSGFREEEQFETWECLQDIRQKYTVVDVDMANKDGHAYDDLIKTYWGKDDFINIEMDNVVSLSNIDSLANCPESYCSYLYPCDYVWGKDVPTDAMGVVKIGKSLQDKVPAEGWYKKGDWHTLDARLKNQIAQALTPNQVVVGVLKAMTYKIKGVPFAHVHNTTSTMLKHNHPHRLGEVDPVTGKAELLEEVIKRESEWIIDNGKAFDIALGKEKRYVNPIGEIHGR